MAYQRLAWEALKKSINGLINKVRKRERERERQRERETEELEREKESVLFGGY